MTYEPNDELAVRKLSRLRLTEVADIRRPTARRPIPTDLHIGIAGTAVGSLPRFSVADPVIGRELVVVGLAAKFNEPVPAGPRWGGRWQFRPGSFCRAMRTQAISLHLMHESSIVVATTADRSLSLWEGGDGPMFRLNPPHTLTAREVLRHARDQAFTGASIGFRPSTSVCVTAGDLCSFTEVDLHEISLVTTGTLPRFKTTWIKVMSELDSWHIEESAFADIVVNAARSVSYGDRSWDLATGGTYRIPVILAGLLVNSGLATMARRHR